MMADDEERVAAIEATRAVTSRPAGRVSESANPPLHSIGFSPASISARRGSRNGGSASFSPSVAIGSSVAKPGPSVAISNRMPLGSRKYRLRK